MCYCSLESANAQTDGFDAVIQAVDGPIPPDPEIAVGYDHIVVITNQDIAFFDKAGIAIRPSESISAVDGFWGSMEDIPIDWRDNIFDPEVHFDFHAGLFWAMAAWRDSSAGESYFLLAVTDEPAGTWNKYAIGPFTGLMDSPNLTIDDLYVYLNAIVSQHDPIAFVYRLDKQPFINGDPAPAGILLPTVEGSLTVLQGLPMPYSYDGQPQYMVETYSGGADKTDLQLWALDFDSDPPTRQEWLFAVPRYSQPNDVPQRDTDVLLLTFNTRIWSCMYRDGSIWAVHHITRPLQPHTIIRWYEIQLNGWPYAPGHGDPVVAQWGEIDPNSARAIEVPKFTFYPSIAADGAGNAVITYSRSSVREYPSIRRAFRIPSDPPGTFPDRSLVRASLSCYDTGGNFDRWGDYSGTKPDPSASCLFWGFNEYVGSTTRDVWYTWVSRYEPCSGASNPFAPDTNGFARFIDAIVSGNPRADLNQDGLVSTDDLVEYIKWRTR